MAGADPSSLLTLRGKASAEYGAFRERIAGAGGPAAFIEELRALEASCTTLLAEYQPALVPGLLQTPAWMREMAEDEEFLEENGINAQTIGPLIVAKIRRQAILYEGGRQIIHILGEAALHTRVGKVTPATMRSQLDHLAETAQLPGHELGIVPFSVPSPVAPASGFVLYDSDLVVIETLGGRINITDPELVSRHERWLEQLRQAAITGPEAAEMCRQAVRSLGKMKRLYQALLVAAGGWAGERAPLHLPGPRQDLDHPYPELVMCQPMPCFASAR